MCKAGPSRWQEPNVSRLALGREEFDRLGRGHRLDVLVLEAEHADARDQLAFQLRVVELGRDDAAVGDLAARRDRQLHDHLALQLRLLAQRPAVERIDRRLVSVEDDLYLLAAARGLAARAGAAGLRAVSAD